MVCSDNALIGQHSCFYPTRGGYGGPDRRRWTVELRPFNNALHDGDLNVLCTRVAIALPQLPDERQLVFAVGSFPHFQR